jgi:hypothetical protein
MTVSFDACYERTADVHAVDVDGETVVYVAATESLHLLDGTASVVWWALDNTTTLGVICDELADAFGVAAERIRGDVEPLVKNLVEAGLVTGTPATPGDE